MVKKFRKKAGVQKIFCGKKNYTLDYKFLLMILKQFGVLMHLAWIKLLFQTMNQFFWTIQTFYLASSV